MTDAIDGLEIHGVPMVEASKKWRAGEVAGNNIVEEGLISSLQNDVVEIKDSATR
jgi:hypothetical protein